MTHPLELEDAIERALDATRRCDYDEALRCLSFAFTRAAHARGVLHHLAGRPRA